MRHKNDIAIAATSARSYNRHWRAHKLSWTEIGKIKYLFDGAYEYMDDVTLAYPREQFNKLRKVLGFKQDSELSELVEKSEAFRIVRHKDTRQMEAFMSPFVGDRFVPTANQEIEEPAIPYDLFFCKANALANDNDRDKISENQRQHRNGIDMHVLLAGNVPKFHVEAKPEAHERVSAILNELLDDDEYMRRYFGECIYQYAHKYKVDYPQTYTIVKYFVLNKLIEHMSRRVGVENWPEESVIKWVDYYFGVKRLPRVIAEIREEWMRRVFKPNKNNNE